MNLRNKLNKNKVIRNIVFILIAIGVLVQFTNNPSGMMIPLIVFGVVYYLYKFPPSRSGRGKSMFDSMFTKGKQKRKPPAFRVIPGNKKEEDEEPPRYH